MTQDASPPRSQRFSLRICDGPSCGLSHDSDRLAAHVRGVIARDPELASRVSVAALSCFGRCDEGPNCFFQALGPHDDPTDEPEPEVLETQRGFYPGVDRDSLTRIVTEHGRSGRPVEGLVDDY